MNHWTPRSEPFRLTDAEPARYLSRDDAESLFKRIVSFTQGGGDTTVYLDSRWTGNVRWARNRATTAGDTSDHTVRIARVIRGARGDVSTNKFDDESLRAAVQSAERIIRFYSENVDAAPPPGKQQYLKPELWSDNTYNLDALKRSDTARRLTEPAVEQKLVAAGYLQVAASTRSVFNTRGLDAHYAATGSEYSTTIRNREGTGSGWAGVSNKDWNSIDATALSRLALTKCVESADPRAIEPGRYTVIMEPQAVHSLFVQAIYALDRYAAENFQTVYTLSPGQSKIGLKVFDEKITVSADPMDPEGGFIPFDYEGYPHRPVTWIQNGILKELSYTRQYALSQLGHGVPLPNSMSYRMSGGTASLAEMIATTERGLLVTRFSGVTVIDGGSLLSTGVSRDGLWLIERGKIKFPVKNMRFTDSPMFAFNNVQQMGAPQRVYGSPPAIVPAMKVKDFNFSSLSDAV